MMVKDVLQGKGFMLIARVDSPIAGTGEEDAIWRATLYRWSGAESCASFSRRWMPLSPAFSSPVPPPSSRGSPQSPRCSR
ncbi:hypothetical protein UK99_15310 [Frankia casuarinae]|nr:hypothetical protein UK99_15310 [Frankia casuarinae]